VSPRLTTRMIRFKTLRAHIEHDIKILDKVLSLVEPIKPEQDASYKRSSSVWIRNR